MTRLYTPSSPSEYNAKLFALLFPHGYTPPPEPLALPRLTIEPRSVLDQDLDEAAINIAVLSIRGQRSISCSGNEHDRSDEYQYAVADTAQGGYCVAESLVHNEPVVAALVVEIYRRAATWHNMVPAHLRAQVEMQLTAVEAARSLQRYVPTAEQTQLLSMKQASLLHRANPPPSPPRGALFNQFAETVQTQHE